MTRYKNLYEITFAVKKGGWSKYIFQVEAFNMNEAKELAKEYWYNTNKSHMFDIKARRVKDDEILDLAHWFKKES